SGRTALPNVRHRHSPHRSRAARHTLLPSLPAADRKARRRMNPTILLIIGAVGLVGCIVLLLLGLNMLREERTGKQGQAPAAPGGAVPEANSAAAEAAKPVSAASGPNPLAGVTARLSGAGARGSAHEVLRVLRDNLTGRLVLEIAGKRYASLDGVGEGDMRQALM